MKKFLTFISTIAIALSGGVTVFEVSGTSSANAVESDRHKLLTSWDYGMYDWANQVNVGGRAISLKKFESEISSKDITDGGTSSSPSYGGSWSYEAFPRTTCVVASGYLYCWGRNEFGQLGIGNTVSTDTPTLVSAASGLPQGQITQVIVANRFVCALANGSVYCWGRGVEGQLSNGGADSSLPIKISGSLEGKTVDEIAGDDGWADTGYVVARVAGNLYHWGSIYDRTTCSVSGNTSTCSNHSSTISAPTEISGSLNSRTFTKIKVSGNSAMGIADGKVYSWGLSSPVWGSQSSLSDADNALDITPIVGGTPLAGVSDYAGNMGEGIALVDGRIAWSSSSFTVPADAPRFKSVAYSRTGGGGSPSYFAIGVDGSLWYIQINNYSSSPGTLARAENVGTVTKVVTAGQDYYANMMVIGAVRASIPAAATVSSRNRTSLNVNWIEPTSNGGSAISRFKVRLYVADETSPASTTEVSGSSTSTVISGLSAGLAYRVTIAAVNSAGETAESEKSDLGMPGIIASPTADTGVSINSGGSYVNTKSVNLNLSWPANAVSVRVSNDGGFRGESVKTFDIQDGIPWNLDDSVVGTFTKTVYVRFIGYGVDSTRSYTDDIILDTAAPTIKAVKTNKTTSKSEFTLASFTPGASPVSITTAAFRPAAIKVKVAKKVVTKRVVLAISAKDNLSGVRQVQISRFSNGSKALTSSYRASFKLTVVKSVKKLFIRVQDGAGNWSKWKAAVVK